MSNGLVADDRFAPWWNNNWPLMPQIYQGVQSHIWIPQVYTDYRPSSSTVANAQSLAQGRVPGF